VRVFLPLLISILVAAKDVVKDPVLEKKANSEKKDAPKSPEEVAALLYAGTQFRSRLVPFLSYPLGKIWSLTFSW
jgi:hypothetical protein